MIEYEFFAKITNLTYEFVVKITDFFALNTIFGDEGLASLNTI